MSVVGEHILVVDDDDRLRELLKKFLSENGFRVTAAEDANAAKVKMDNIKFDLIVLDRMMPGETGIEFAQKVREDSKIPILMLTAMGEIDDRISGLQVGVDDYLVKPFEPLELLLRINAILRRIPEESESCAPVKTRLGEFVFDLEREELHRGDEMIGLTTAETRLLKVLAQKPGTVFSREYLKSLVTFGGGERTVDVQVNRLRHKIEPDAKLPRYLQTIRGQGYVLRPD